MGCKFPEHHGGGADTGTGGSWWPLVVAVIVAALFAPVIGVFIHVLSLVLTFTGMAAIAAGGGWLWWRVSHRQRTAIPSGWQTWERVPRGRYVPQMQPQRGRQQPPAVEQGGQHLHLHLGDLSRAERAEAIRQIRGGQ